MIEIRRFSAIGAALLLTLALPAFAQDAEKPGSAVAAGEGTTPGNEIAELRKAIDSQSLKIEMLTREISELRRKLSGGAEGEAATKPAPGAPAAAAETATAPKENAPAQPEVRAAEATGGGVKHIVAKGESLTSIAKQYNIPVATLQSANKIQDARKLQIGQVLTIPAAPETSPDKKEKP